MGALSYLLNTYPICYIQGKGNLNAVVRPDHGPTEGDGCADVKNAQ